MKYLLAPDSFKGSATALEICKAMAEGIRRIDPAAVIDLCPMADGGEGTVRGLVDSYGGELRQVTVTGPSGRPTDAEYGVIGDICLMEAAETSGLTLLSNEERNPLKTATKGLGELIESALDEGMREFLIGIGGTGTNDGGAGMAAALGYRFIDEEGNPIDPCGGNLAALAHIDCSEVDPRIRESVFRIACDVDNPLCGPGGASAIYGPQKGATPEMVQQLDANLLRLGTLIKTELGLDVIDMEGAGAAGGLGAGAVAFLGAKLSRGVELVADMVKLEDKLKDADVVITGEGRCDHQTLMGKVISGVAGCANSRNVPVVVIAGSVEPGEWQTELEALGVKKIVGIKKDDMSLDYAIEHVLELVAEETANAIAM